MKEKNYFESASNGHDKEEHPPDLNIRPEDFAKFLDLENIEAESIDTHNYTTPKPDEKRYYTGLEIRNLPIDATPRLLDPIFPRVGIVGLTGSSDTGKSMILRQLAISIVNHEKNSLGFSLTPKHHRALMVQTEDSQQDVKILLAKQAKNVSDENLENLQLIFSPENALHETEERLKEIRFDVVIVDAWGDVAGVDTNVNSKVRDELNKWQRLAIKYECLIIFLHHTGKRTDNREPNKHNAIGAQGFEAKARTIIELRKDSNNPNLRHFCIVKGNHLPPDFKRESYELTFDPENFRFHNTGKRTPFDQLKKLELNVLPDDKKEKYIKAKKLQTEGVTLSNIAPHLGFSTKSPVSKLITEGDKAGWSVS